MHPLMDEVTDKISGLSPDACLVLSPGFVREEWKSICFAKGKALTAAAIQSPAQIAQLLVPEAEGRILEQSARIELLRDSFKAAEVRDALPHVVEHRFRPRFHEALDRALQRGRSLFVHSEEALVFRERLQEKNGASRRRDEYFDLNRFWETLLELREFFDEARLFEAATHRLSAGARLPFSQVFWLSHFPLPPRIRHFKESLAKSLDLREVHSSGFFIPDPAGAGSEGIRFERRRCHSLEDAAHHLLDAVTEGGVDHDVVVIEDRPEVRRTLQRVSLARGIPLQDARDPTLLPQSEELKAALLELELSARDFPRDLVLAWIGLRAADRGDLRRRLLEGNQTRGIDAVRFDPALFESLQKISEVYRRKMTLSELEAAIGGSIRSLGLPSWTAAIIGAALSEWHEGFRLLGKSQVRRPARFWLKELGERLKSMPPPTPPVRHERGLRVYRVDQAVSFALPEKVRVHFFGVSARFFEPREESTEWFSGRDLEALGFDFSVPDRRTRKEGVRNSFRSWVARSTESPVFWEFVHDASGGEEESPELALRSVAGIGVDGVLELPVHPSVLPSLQADLKPPVTLARIPFSERELPMSFLNALGNCAFTAYVQHLLGLFDERDPDFDLGGDVYGNLIHSAIEILMEGKGTVDATGAFERAWEKTSKPAWVRSERLFSAMRKRAIRLLEVFEASDREYRSRSGAELKAQERDIQWKREGFIFSGRLDRVDQHADGLVLMDYKTSSRQAGGQEALESGKGLQLAAYALALQEAEKQPVVSAQYVVLSPEKINRNYGVLFQKWNKGKAADEVAFPLSFVRSNNSSLFHEDPEAVWNAFDSKILSLIRRALDQGFQAAPADPADCDFCRYSGVCGRGRLVLA
jgi:RecB family exonuclease